MIRAHKIRLNPTGEQKMYFARDAGVARFTKIAYFATEEGVPTGLHFVRESYGPFSPEVQALITRLVNNGVIREVKLGNMLAIQPVPTYSDAVQAYRADLEQWETSINRIVDLFLRYAYA